MDSWTRLPWQHTRDISKLSNYHSPLCHSWYFGQFWNTTCGVIAKYNSKILRKEVESWRGRNEWWRLCSDGTQSPEVTRMGLQQLRKSIGHPAIHSCLQTITAAPGFVLSPSRENIPHSRSSSPSVHSTWLNYVTLHSPPMTCLNIYT